MENNSGGPGLIWDVYVIEYAKSKDQPVATLIQGAYDQGTIDLPFAFVLARSGDRNILVDCGFMKEGNGVAVAEKFGIPNWISPVTMIGEMGVTAEAVTDIVLSHAHFDHMGSVEKFPNAQLHLQKRELLSWIELMAMPRQFGFLTAVLDPDDIYSALDAAKEHRLDLIEGDQDDVVPGVHVRTGPGHTFGQQFAILETAKGRVVVAGDCIYGSQNLTGIEQQRRLYPPRLRNWQCAGPAEILRQDQQGNLAAIWIGSSFCMTSTAGLASRWSRKFRASGSSR